MPQAIEEKDVRSVATTGTEAPTMLDAITHFVHTGVVFDWSANGRSVGSRFSDYSC